MMQPMMGQPMMGQPMMRPPFTGVAGAAPGAPVTNQTVPMRPFVSMFLRQFMPCYLRTIQQCVCVHMFACQFISGQQRELSLI